MNRVEYMTRLAAMLQDIPVEERQEAMKYYNDYFDEAGEENEEKVAAELDSPEKVAAVIKAEIYGRNNTGETKAPVYPAEKEEKDTNNWWKILLIIVGGLFVLSIAGPIVLGVALTVLAVVFSGFIALIAFVIAAGCLAIVGIALFIGGCHNEKRMEEILDHKWCDCRNRRAVFDFGIYTGSLFFKDQVWFPIYISIEQQGGDSKGKHRADRRRKNVRRGKKSGNGCGSYECISEAFPKWKSMCGH